MTASALTRITCNRHGPTCLGHADFDGGRRPARAAARRAGWFHSRQPDFDVCPTCQQGAPR